MLGDGTARGRTVKHLFASTPFVGGVCDEHPMLREARRQAEGSARLRTLTDTERKHVQWFMLCRGRTFEAAFAAVRQGARVSAADLDSQTPRPQPERIPATEPSRHIQGPRKLSRAKRKKLRAKGKR